MLTQKNAQLLLRYYRTSILYLLLTAIITAIIFGLRLFNIFTSVPITAATVHLGTLGALTLGLMGLYLRLFYSLESVTVNEWTVKTIHILMNIGIGLLTLGYVAGHGCWFCRSCICYNLVGYSVLPVVFSG